MHRHKVISDVFQSCDVLHYEVVRATLLPGAAQAGHFAINARVNTSMKLVSVNCGLPRKVEWHGRSVTTAIYKVPVKGRVALRKLNLDGDRQADLSVHGGADKAVYCYPAGHYDYWKAELSGRELPARHVWGELYGSGRG